MTRRLAAAFAVVAVLAVAVLAALTLWSARAEVSGLVDAQNAETAAAAAREAGTAFVENGGSWTGADTRPAHVVAASANASLLLRDAAGAPVAGTGRGPAGAPGPRRNTVPLGEPVTIPIVVADRPVGTAELRFPLAVPAPQRAVRDALVRTVLLGSALALVIAIGAGVVAGGWIRSPVRRLTSAATAMSAGDLRVRVGAVRGGGEFRELGRAFDAMAVNVQREDEVRRAMVADVAHELRTPVAVLQAEVEAMLDGLRPATEPALASVHEEVLRLGRLIEDLGTLSAARAAGLTLRREAVDLAALARSALSEMEPIAAAEGVRTTAITSPVLTEGDPLRLGQIARNLVANAIKFTPAGGTVRIRAHRDGAGAVLVVEDTGPGIPPQELPHVFERFWRGAGSGTAEGTGIGLAVVAELVAAHGGTVTAESPAAGGARFTVRLPHTSAGETQ